MTSFDSRSPRLGPFRGKNSSSTLGMIDKPDKETINHIVFGSIFELSNVAIRNARSVRMLLTSCTQILDHETTDSLTQLSVGMTSAASRITEEISLLQCEDVQENLLTALDHAKTGLNESSFAFITAQRNWLSMVSPSTSRSRMIDASVAFENQCNRVMSSLESILFVPEKLPEAPPTPPPFPLNDLENGREDDAQDEDHLQKVTSYILITLISGCV